ncbi:hypothetical protein A6U97_28160 [Agrobacterium tumefaciens]|nr:hypothetical protein A6U97_28160 [Agrobacterium tumefaciens]
MACDPQKRRETMATIIALPQQQALDARLRKQIEEKQQFAEDALHPAIESILALMEQLQRTNTAIAEYRANLATESIEIIVVAL